MNYQDLIEHFGTEAKAAAARNIPRQNVHAWKRTGNIPLEQQVQWELVTSGKLRADLPDEIRAS